MTDTIVLGLDGATWDILDPLLKDDLLPNLRSLIDQGQADTLRSTFPPITAPAWLSMATGQNPGKTGVFYFLNRDDPDSFEFESLGSDAFQGQSFWDMLSTQNHSVGIFNFPMLYPPYELGKNSFMISGLGSPEDKTIAKPDGLKSELDDVTGGYEVKVPYADPKYRNKPSKLEADLHEILNTRETAIEYLLEEKGPDVFFGIVSVTDWAQHYFWRYHDPEHPLYDPSADKDARTALRRLWERVDETVGKVANFAEEENATLLLVSDHGFGPTTRTFYSNSWLEEQDLRVPAETSTLESLRTRYFPYLRQIAEPVVAAIPQLNDFAKSVGESIRGSLSDDIDWEQSIVFAPRQNLTCGMLYMLSDNPDDEAAVISKLKSLTDQHGESIAVEVHRPEDLYHGPKTELAPDILFTVEGFECAVDPRHTTGNEYFDSGPPSAARSGGHRMEGIYIAAGSGVESGEGVPAEIFDIAPTLLYTSDEPIPDVMDGEPLTELFTDEFREQRSARRRSLSELVSNDNAARERDTDAVQERLEDLGYI